MVSVQNQFAELDIKKKTTRPLKFLEHPTTHILISKASHLIYERH